MAIHVLTDASVTVGGTDLSDHVQSVTIEYGAETHDDSAMGNTTRTMIGGLKTWSAAITFQQDYAASEVNATLFSNVGSDVAFVAKPTSGAVSSTNPSYTGTAVLADYQPIAGSVGDFHTITVNLVAAGNLVMATS